MGGQICIFNTAHVAVSARWPILKQGQSQLEDTLTQSAAASTQLPRTLDFFAQ